MGEENHVSFRTAFRRAETTRRGTRVIVTLCRHRNERGSWPQDLQAAIDEKDGPLTDGWDRPFVYKPETDGFVLYSMGENGVNENGERRTEYDEEDFTSTVLADDVMIWPSRKGEGNDGR